MRTLKMLCLAIPLLISTPSLAEEPAEAFQASAQRGQKTFETVCAHCHYATHQVSAVGCPGLKDVLTRHDATWLNHWLTSPEAFSKKDIKAKAVVDANPYGLVMPTLPEMQQENDRLDIIEFLKTLK